MKKTGVLLISACALFASAWGVAQSAAEVIKDVVPRVQSWSTNPVLVAAVRKQNAKYQSQESIQTKEKAWAAQSESDPAIQYLLKNEAAQELNKLQQTQPFFTELILMDSQGALVAMTHRTSDYWQGDEAKFTETYPRGTQAVHKSAPTYDASVGAYVVQVSVPVIESGKNIGALTVNIKLSEVRLGQ